MVRICKISKDKVLQQIHEKEIKGIIQSRTDLIDDIILSMNKEGVLECLSDGIPDRRNHNITVPHHIIMTLAIAAKMKGRMSVTDIPFAIQNHKTLLSLGYMSINKDCKDGWMTEGAIRAWIRKYDPEDLLKYYNEVLQDYIMPLQGIEPNIHVTDCTKLEVNIDNENYEGATLGHDHNNNRLFRGYNLATLRGIVGDKGVIEEIKLGTAKNNDLALSEEVLKNSKCFHENDILIMDRGYIKRELLNYLKKERKVDVYIPVRSDMEIYQSAIDIANHVMDWHPHPTRVGQLISQVNNVGIFWKSDNVEEDVDLNACVVALTENKYAVFITTDTSKTANDIIRTYELRPEIEEDFRQLKDFWKLEDFKSTKLNVIAFHIICVLFGYLFYQLYLLTEDGEKYLGRSLPVLMKNYVSEWRQEYILYSDNYFCVMKVKEFILYRDRCNEEIKDYLLSFF